MIEANSMKLTSLQRQILMAMPDRTGRGMNAADIHYAMYNARPTLGSLLSDRITKALTALSINGLIHRPRSGGLLFTNRGYRLSEQGESWVKTERERISHAAANEGSDIAPWVGAA